MIPILVLLVVLALLIAMAYAGYRDGLYTATYALMRGLIAFLCAMTFFGPLAYILTNMISDKDPAPQYFRALAFIAIFGIVLVVAKLLKVQYTDPGAGCPIMVDRTAGPVVGVLNGIVFTGAILIFWSMLPFAKFIPDDQGRVNAKLGSLDTGAVMLKFYSFARGRMPGNTDFLLNDEPRELDAAGNMTAFTDENRNGQWDHGWLWEYEHYADIDTSVLPVVVAGPSSEDGGGGASP